MTTLSRRRGHLPPPDSPVRLVVIRVVAVVALAATATYLAWRAAATMNVAAWYLSVPMLVLEVHAAIGLGLFTFSLWDVDVRPRRRSLDHVPTVAVLIPTYNEGPEILVPTIAAAVALQPAHETWVLDDGERPEVAELAASLGALYLVRTSHEHAKAGNVNHALGIVEAEILAVLDADHVAAPEFLRATLGYFADPKVALVQTPQDSTTSPASSTAAASPTASHSMSRRSFIGCFSPARTDGAPPSGAAPTRSCAPRRCARSAAPRPRRSPRTSIPPSGSTVPVGGPSTTTRSWHAAWRPMTLPSTSSSATGGGPERCRCCASRIH